MLWSSTCPVHMVWEREAWDWLVVRYDVDYMQFLVLVMANVQQVLSIQVLFISCIKKRILQSLICFCWIYSKSTSVLLHAIYFDNVFVFFQISGMMILTY